MGRRQLIIHNELISVKQQSPQNQSSPARILYLFCLCHLSSKLLMDSASHTGCVSELILLWEGLALALREALGGSFEQVQHCQAWNLPWALHSAGIAQCWDLQCLQLLETGDKSRASGWV